MSPRAHSGDKIKNFCVKRWGGSWTENRDGFTHLISPVFRKPGFCTLKKKKSKIYVYHLSLLFKKTNSSLNSLVHVGYFFVSRFCKLLIVLVEHLEPHINDTVSAHFIACFIAILEARQ